MFMTVEQKQAVNAYLA